MHPTEQKPLKIAFISRSTLYSSPGGDTIQIGKTAECLRKIGHDVAIFTTDAPIPYVQFDLFHYFNLTRPADILFHIAQTKKPFFVSPIFLDLREFEQKARKGWAGLITRSLSPAAAEYVKCIARRLKNGERIRSWYYLLNGHTASVRKILSECTALFPNSASELSRLKAVFDYTGAADIVPCGVDASVFGSPSGVERDANLVLCVGRIEARKNQLSLIHALRNTAFELVIIGKPSPNHRAYFESCRKAAGKNVQFIDNIDHEELVSYYHRAAVHVLPSWFETVGLTSLEAAYCGCNIVVTDKGDVSDYFPEHMAWYCDPADTDSIRAAVCKAAAAPPGEALRERIAENYSWSRVAAMMNMFYAKYL
ncbi:glycosyltransferase family 4 protein [Rurimicrobium arvi]|uniref:Glycosyltransferase n=1 Tax=Rurimicrobium arvi TaxID=2049916 RepID=A0ABP8MXC6_9BACT